MRYFINSPWIILLGSLSLSGISQAQVPNHAEPKEKPLSFWMEKKVEYSQDILRGLVSGDLETVAERAEQMRVLSKVEGWIRGKKPGYRTQLQVFEFTNNEMLRHARNDNLEGTTMAFQHMTASCVSCHRSIRETNGHAIKPRAVAPKKLDR